MWHDLVSREEGLNAVLDKALRLDAVGRALGPVEVCLLKEKEDRNDSEGSQGHTPPVLDGPVVMSSNKAREGRTCRGAEVECQMENGESAATLVQEEHVDQVARAKHTNNNAKKG